MNLKHLQINHRIVPTIATITFLALLAIPVQPAAQESSGAPKKQARYRLIDLGTLGGPNSSEFASPIISKQGAITGASDTAVSDPNAPNCYNSDCFVNHAYIWRKGILTDWGDFLVDLAAKAMGSTTITRSPGNR